jgi:hypothetical protein
VPLAPLKLYILFSPHTEFNRMKLANYVTSQKNIDDVTSAYYLFKYSVRSEATRNYYERRIKKGGEKFYNHNFIKINYPAFL